MFGEIPNGSNVKIRIEPYDTKTFIRNLKIHIDSCNVIR